MTLELPLSMRRLSTRKKPRSSCVTSRATPARSQDCSARLLSPIPSSPLRVRVRTSLMSGPEGAGGLRSAHRWPPRMWAVDYSHGDDWMVLRVKLMSRSPRLAPLSATTPVGCWPAVAQIRLSWTW